MAEYFGLPLAEPQKFGMATMMSTPGATMHSVHPARLTVCNGGHVARAILH